MDPNILDGILSSPELLAAAAKLAGELLSRAPSPEAAPASSDGGPDTAAPDGSIPAASASDGESVPASAPAELPGDGSGDASRSAPSADALSALMGLLGGAAPPSPARSGENANVSGPLSALLGAAGGGRREAPSSPPALDPKLLAAAAQVLGAVGTDDDRTRLLLALKPLLRREKAERVDRAVRILKVSTAIRAAINSLAGGDKGDVLKI